jgi:site-specific DNA recombinase
MRRDAPKTQRCAIYIRVSTEHGLEQDFNSLDAQREASEAYIKSQAHEGWRCLPAHYDDGGFSGGSLERPALRQLLSDIRARLIDVVVVYKVDRLTRSLADFAKLVELFDEHAVSFVSVTQAFNTTTSMGRLTLNVLLSFAQFEREVTGERIRDKIAASKKKGIWMGGVVPLGYRVANRALHPVEEHAGVIRGIFSSYLGLGTVAALKERLDREAIMIPERVDGGGRTSGGKPFSRGHLYKILSNPIYIGSIAHKGRTYDGQHEAIIAPETWAQVAERLASQVHARKRRRLSSESLLTGRIFDDRGNRMTPATAQKGSRRYRYYTSQALLRGNRGDAGSVPRVPAPEIEAAVMKLVQEVARDPSDHRSTDSHDELAPIELLQRHVERVVVHRTSLEVLTRSDGEQPVAPIMLPWAHQMRIRRREILSTEGAQNANQPAPRRMRAEDRARLLIAIAKARLWVDQLLSGEVLASGSIAEREGYSERSVRMMMSLAFLPPAIVLRLSTGKLIRIGAVELSSGPADWSKYPADWEGCAVFNSPRRMPPREEARMQVHHLSGGQASPTLDS